MVKAWRYFHLLEVHADLVLVKWYAVILYRLDSVYEILPGINVETELCAGHIMVGIWCLCFHSIVYQIISSGTCIGVALSSWNIQNSQGECGNTLATAGQRLSSRISTYFLVSLYCHQQAPEFLYHHTRCTPKTWHWLGSVACDHCVLQDTYGPLLIIFSLNIHISVFSPVQPEPTWVSSQGFFWPFWERVRYLSLWEK